MIFADFGDNVVIFLIVGFVLTAWVLGTICRGIGKAAKHVVKSETAQEVGTGLLAGWLNGLFGK